MAGVDTDVRRRLKNLVASAANGRVTVRVEHLRMVLPQPPSADPQQWERRLRNHLAALSPTVDVRADHLKSALEGVGGVVTDWVLHVGNNCPVPRDTPVRVLLAGGTSKSPRRAGSWAWGSAFSAGGTPTRGRIVAYAVVTPENSSLLTQQWIPYDGGDCPLLPDVECTTLLRSGADNNPYYQRAADWSWGELDDGTITHYRVRM